MLEMLNESESESENERGWGLNLMRPSLLHFLLHSAQQLRLTPIVKYSALSFFLDRFYLRFKAGCNVTHWLLQPPTESNLQLFALVTIWISTKIHDSRPMSLRSLKSFGDSAIKDQHFTHADFLDAEVVFMQVLDFEIGAGNIAFLFLEDLLLQLKEVAKVGELVDFEACMDIMDLLYQKESWNISPSPHSVAASILVASYVITVPKQRWEFPILPWVRFVTGCEEQDILGIVRQILDHVFLPFSS